jgi:maleylpyruvate isomerase
MVMTTVDHAPHDVLAQLAESEARMRAIVTPLAEADLALPSALPGWTAAHLLTHLARNADSHVRRIEASHRGEMVEQYEGGLEGRNREIDEGAQRDAQTIVDDVIESSLRLDAAWWTVQGGEWMAESSDATGVIRQVRTLPARRLQEVEVHIADLGLGYDQREWSDVFVVAFLDEMRATMPSRVPQGSDIPSAATVAALPPRDELAWLYGRAQFDGLPELLPLGSTNADATRG